MHNNRGAIQLSVKESIRFQIVSKFMNGALNRVEAARILNTRVRTVTRISKKIKSKGILGVQHGNVGIAPFEKYNKDFKSKILKLFLSHAQSDFGCWKRCKTPQGHRQAA